MNVNFKGLLYTLITLFVLFLVTKFILGALPYIIVAILIIWGIFKIKKKTSHKKEDVEEKIYTSTYESKSNEEDEENDDFDTSKAIDVDFEDVENK
ncbi:MAG: hypothetical protein ACRC28_16760 [Clostridium sp.]|uniref:hypothetical protein n=1 Tax=Clostridium sp. TaxID=1506 RepID=UPI003F3AF2DC